MRNSLNLENLPTIDFINAGGTLAFYSELVWVKFFYLSIAELNLNFGCLRVVIHFCLQLRLDFNQLFFYRLRHPGVGLNDVKVIGQADYERRPIITHFSDVFGDRYLKTMLYSIALLNRLVEALTKYSMLLRAGATLIVSHVFDKANRRHFQLIKHLDTLYDIDVRKSLRRCHNHSTRECKFLAKSQLNVTSAWWKVNDEIVQIAPGSLPYQLRHEIANHGTAHDGSLSLSREAIRHTFDTGKHDRCDHLRIIFVLVEVWHLSFYHRWETRTVHVGVKNANFSTLLPEGEGQVDGDCGFAYATLTAADSDDVVDFCEACCALGLFLLGRFLARRHLNFNFVDPGKFLKVFSDE